jgi:hypothetical protein
MGRYAPCWATLQTWRHRSEQNVFSGKFHSADRGHRPFTPSNTSEALLAAQQIDLPWPERMPPVVVTLAHLMMARLKGLLHDMRVLAC